MGTTVVIGCGIAGLGAAQVLEAEGADYIVIEQDDGPGGLLRTDRVGDFLFDRAGHFIHTRNPSFERALSGSGIEFKEHTRTASVMLGGAIVPYPLQFNLWAAPEALREKVGRELPGLTAASSIARSFEDALLAAWGPALMDAFFRPYHEKMLSTRLKLLPANWGANFIPAPDIERIRQGFERPLAGYGYNARFAVPVSGRIGDLPEAVAGSHGDRISLRSRVKAISLGDRSILVSAGDGERSIGYSAIVATLPLPRLLRLCGGPCHGDLFAHANLLNVRVGFRGRIKRPEHWFYTPDPELPFFRIGIPSNVSPRVCPPDCASLSIECGGASRQDPQAVARCALAYLEEHGAIEFKAMEVLDTYLISPAYVYNRMTTTAQIRQLAHELGEAGVIVAGRYGTWDYLSIDQAYQSGADAAFRSLGSGRSA